MSGLVLGKQRGKGWDSPILSKSFGEEYFLIVSRFTKRKSEEIS